MDKTHWLLTDEDTAFPTLYLNRPDCHNAFNTQTFKTLQEILLTLEKKENIKALFLRAKGRYFSAGADLHWMKNSIHLTEADNKKDAEIFANSLYTLYNFPAPTIAFVEGSAYGGGIGLIAACDLAYGIASSHFCFSEVKLGLIPAVISPYVMRAMGEKQTMYYFLTAEKFNAKIALQHGLLQQIFDENTAETTLLQLKNQLELAEINALRDAKKLVHTIAKTTISPNIITLTAERIAKKRSSPEAQKRINAFFTK